MSVINNNELIFYQKDGVVMSGGYSLKSELLKNGISPMQTLNTLEQASNNSSSSKSNSINNNNKQKVSDMFSNLVVPVGLLLLNKTKDFSLQLDKTDELYSFDKNKGNGAATNHSMLSDDIYEQLFKIVQFDDSIKKKYTKTKRHVKAAVAIKTGKQTKKRKGL